MARIGRPDSFTPETLALARRLREEEGKTYAQIAQILSIGLSSVKRAALRDNWAGAASKEKKKEMGQAAKIEREHRVKKGQGGEDDSESRKAIEELESIGINKPREYSLKGLGLTTALLVKRGIQGDNKSLIAAHSGFLKIAEATGAFRFGGEQRKLTVFVPAVAETYEEPPEEKDEDDYVRH